MWDLAFENGIYLDQFDYVIVAVHADVATSILIDESSFDVVNSILKNFKYFDAQIVIHQYTSYIQNENPAFLNIFTNTENELAFTTMNLSLISNRMSGIYKSWLNEKDTELLASKNQILHKRLFTTQ